MHHNNNENDNKPLHDPDPKQDSDHEQGNEICELDNDNEPVHEIDERDDVNEPVHEMDEPDEDYEDEDDDSDYEPAVRRRWIKNTVIVVLVAALLGNILAFWPQIYNMETLPFLFKSRELSSREDIQNYKQAVVLIGTDKGKGTGFHISSGFIMTNYHVIEDAAYSIVEFPENNGRFVANVAGFDANLDVAVLQVDSDGQDLPFIEIERERKWEPGQHIYVIGNPLYFTQIVNEGYVLGAVPLQGRHKPALAVDAPVFKGNSGSPVINEHGNVIAIIYATGEMMHEGSLKQVGLAVPLNDLGTLLQNLLPEK